MNKLEVRKVARRIPESLAGLRLDQALGRLFSEYSRSRLQHWIRNGRVKVDGKIWRPRDPVTGGEAISLEAVSDAEYDVAPQNIPLDICHVDAEILVLAKPSGLVVHPAPGNPDGTLVNALLHHYPELAALPRAGLVHRLDKDTSGLLVVARSLRAHTSLVRQLQERTLSREYIGIVNGCLTAGGTVDQPIGRHPVNRKRMGVVRTGKAARTHYRVNRRFRAHTLLNIKLESGRTHQIRVHMAYLRFPLLGDPVYGGRPRLPRDPDPTLVEAISGFRRQALHAARLGLRHPATGQWRDWQASTPTDMAALLSALEEDASRDER